MYFQELKSLKSYLSDSTGLKKHELKIMNSAIDSLDFWLITRSLRARKRLNPLQFADEAEISWNIAAQLFEMLEKQKVFSSFYEYWSEDGMEFLIRTTDIDKIKSKDTLYNSYTDEYEDIDIELVEVWYELLISPSETYTTDIGRTEKKGVAPTYTLSNVEEDTSVTVILNRVMSRKVGRGH
ncbi:TPA: hypothetical protein J0V25_001483 [Enterococcus faecium]|nr:hypothetical protein [Enterococcus faecium]